MRYTYTFVIDPVILYLRWTSTAAGRLGIAKTILCTYFLGTLVSHVKVRRPSWIPFFNCCNPSCINSSVSYWGMIVPTTRPTTTVQFLLPGKSTRIHTAMFCMLHVIMFPYCCSHLLCCLVWRTKRNDWSASEVISPSASTSCRFLTASCISFRISWFLKWIVYRD